MDRLLTEKQKFLIDNRDSLTKGQKYKLRSSVKRTIQWQIFGILTILIIIFYVDNVYFQLLQKEKNHDLEHHSRQLLVQQYPNSAFSQVRGLFVMMFFFL